MLGTHLNQFARVRQLAFRQFDCGAQPLPEGQVVPGDVARPAMEAAQLIVDLCGLFLEVSNSDTCVGARLCAGRRSRCRVAGSLAPRPFGGQRTCARVGDSRSSAASSSALRLPQVVAPQVAGLLDVRDLPFEFADPAATEAFRASRRGGARSSMPLMSRSSLANDVPWLRVSVVGQGGESARPGDQRLTACGQVWQGDASGMPLIPGSRPSRS